MSYEQVKHNMMANDPKKAEIYNNMVDKTKRVDWNVEEIVTSQKNLMSILFLIHDFGTGEQYARALESLPQLRIILEELEEVAKDKDSRWQANQAAKMRKQLKEQL
tara:strand:+ start:43 stop:360 length:318 start_codon:yes stop_codon:yes gene_type:complete